MPTLVHRETGLAINADGKSFFSSAVKNRDQSDTNSKPGDNAPAAVAHPSTQHTSSASGGGFVTTAATATAPPLQSLSATTETQSPPKSRGASTDNLSDDRGSAASKFHTVNSATTSSPAASSSAHSPIKRTKKIAKPRKSTKAAPSASPLRVRNLLYKSKGGEASAHESFVLVDSLDTASRVGIDASLPPETEQSSKSGKGNGMAAQSLTRPNISNRGKGQKDRNHTPKGKDKKLTKSKKRMQTFSPGGEEIIEKKRAKTSMSDKTVKSRISKLTTKNAQNDLVQSSANRPLGEKNKSARSSKKSDADGLKRIVGVVIDRVAEEIRHCASFFDGGNRPIVVIGSKEEEGDSSRVQSASSAASKEFREIYLDEQQTAQSSSMRIQDDGVARQIDSLDATDNSVDILPRSDEENCEKKQSSDNDFWGANLVVIAIRRFVLEVYCPYLLSAKQNTGNKFPNADRIHLSTLLVIREMLIMNADKLFTFSKLKRSSISMSERMHLSQIFADAIVRNAAKRLHLSDHPEELRFIDKFLQTMKDYDINGEAFQFSLAHVDAMTMYAYQGGGKMGAEESIVAKVGFNYTRERHPLLDNRSITNGDDEGFDQKEPRAAAPSAVHVQQLNCCSAVPTRRVK
jgi:hypothetical protein